MIESIDHLNIVVRNLETAITELKRFGFTATAPAELSGPWISAVVGLDNVVARYSALRLPGDRVTIELIEYGNPPVETDPRLDRPNRQGLRHLALAVRDIDAEVERLTAAGTRFIGPVQTYPATGKRLAYCHGPDGVIIELAEYLPGRPDETP
ncbi:MAG: VOC family protein [Deltaproteobacteria bacterium]|nr:VOC family protein [Candidatus Anaeroferrophillacea bacterium]